MNGIQGHQDLFTTLSSIAGVKNVADLMLKQKKQFIDGIDNLDYWTGKVKESHRNSILYYYEDMTMKEIGATLDLSESRVSQIHTQAMHRLRARMKDWY